MAETRFLMDRCICLPIALIFSSPIFLSDRPPMELLTILLLTLLTVPASGGIVVDTLLAKEIRSQLYATEQVQVRIDNIPNHQLIQGQISRLRIAGKGLWLSPQLRLHTLEVETDPININVNTIRNLEPSQSRSALEQPIGAAVKLVLTRQDINQALNSPEFITTLQSLIPLLFNARSLQQASRRYQITSSQVEFISNNRFRLQTEIAELGYSDRLNLTVEAGINLIAGRRVELIEPIVLVNGQPAPGQFVRGLRAAANKFDFNLLATLGGTARLLQLEMTPESVEMVLFMRVDPAATTP
ncbi:DUF2993 domain-containing protein [[Phormidium] sp. ETS-05]|uniref:LmeA family phospholipid-binding protein n=1 Tax=[Phormidium] sp. ETS-05 TaxID=222819 RepID=UPI0018EED07D|nr:DUF2993 domain-containing protein [[Phormidium] sp. ETS-05]